VSLSATAAPLARVALARDPRRMLAAPAVLVVLGAATATLGPIVGGVVLFGLGAVGGAVIAIGLWLAIRILSLRLLVEPDYLHLHGVGTDRRYHLVRGDMSRLATAGPRKVNLRVRLGSLGWAVGRTALAAGESVEVIRLAATPSVILVPTERGRVAVAVASEADFVDALRAAAHTRAERRISAAGAPLATPALGPAPAAQPAPALQPAPAFPRAPALRGAPTFEPMPAPQPPPAFERPTQPRPLTGIERMWLEDRLARERRAAITGARDEQAAASFTTSVAALTPAGATVVPSSPAPIPAPAAAVAAAAVVSAAVASAVVPAVSAIPAAATAAAAAATATPSAPPRTFPRVIPRRRPSRTMARRVTRPDLTPGLVLIGTPLVGALFSWLLALVTGATPGQAGLDPLAAALLLCGPVAALAIFLAHSRWPRLAGLSSVAAILALLLVTRSVIG